MGSNSADGETTMEDSFNEEGVDVAGGEGW